MAIGKWCMYLSTVLFFLIGFGALAVAVVPGADEWVAEQTLDSAGFSSDDPFQDEAINAITSDEIGGVKTTAWILAGTFIPTAFLFAWCGRWFKSMEGSVPTFGAMMQQSAQMTANVQAAYQPYRRARWSRAVAWWPAARRCRPAHPRSPSSATRSAHRPDDRLGGGPTGAGYGRHPCGPSTPWWPEPGSWPVGGPPSAPSSSSPPRSATTADWSRSPTVRP